jgi:hypothetical protein
MRFINNRNNRKYYYHFNGGENMKRRSRYPDKVIAYVLAERSKGIRWKEITEGIKQTFGIKPPTERQMRDWYKELGGAGDPERLLRENMIRVARAATPWAAFATQKNLVEQVPGLVDAWKEGKDPWIFGGIMVLSMLEQTTGTEAFDKILEEYQQVRQGKIAPGISDKDLYSQEISNLPPGWIETTVAREEFEERGDKK